MLIVPVVDEFSDFRAHVSHDLCKQRLLLHLTDVEAAAAAVQNACVWPLLRDEVRRLVALGPTLFGLVTPVFEETRGRAAEYLSAMESAVPDVLEGRESGLVQLHSATQSLGLLLTGMGEEMRERRPGFSERAVLEYLAGKGSDGWLAELRETVGERLEPAARSLLGNGGIREERYRQFWAASPQAQHLLRCVVVGAAAEDQNARRWEVVSTARALLTDTERVMVAANPLSSKRQRSQLIEAALDAIGCSSRAELLEKVAELAG